MGIHHLSHGWSIHFCLSGALQGDVRAAWPPLAIAIRTGQLLVLCSIRAAVRGRDDLDYEAVHPQGSFARKAVRPICNVPAKTMMEGINRRYGLIYVGTAQCPVCARSTARICAASPSAGSSGCWLSRPTARHSADGPKRFRIRGQLARMQVSRSIVPLTILFDRQTHRARLLGVGFLSEEDIVYRIHSLTTPTASTPMATKRQGTGLDRPGADNDAASCRRG